MLSVVWYALYAALFFLAHKLARERGRPSLLWPIGTIATAMVLEASGSFALGFVTGSELTSQATLGLAAIGAVIAVCAASGAYVGLAIILARLPFRNVRAEPKRESFNYFLLGGVILASGLIVCGYAMSVIMDRFGPRAPMTAIMMLGFVFALAAGHCFRLGRRQSKRLDAQHVLETDARKPVLLLRNFDVDARLGEDRAVDAGFRASIERQLGPLITIGDPSDYLPRVGAARVYCTDDTWREVVVDFLRRVQAVVIVEGSSDQLAWELEQVVRLVLPERVFAVTLPSSSGRVARAARWADLMEMASHQGLSMPPDPGPSAVVGFDDKWEGRVLGSIRDRSLGEILSAELAMTDSLALAGV